MASDSVTSFLDKVQDDPELRKEAQSAYKEDGAEGLVRLGEKHGSSFSKSELDEVISGEGKGSTTALGTSIGWS